MAYKRGTPQLSKCQMSIGDRPIMFSIDICILFQIYTYSKLKISRLDISNVI
jgi:hypothetical protein